jgi:hypothetical protein
VYDKNTLIDILAFSAFFACLLAAGRYFLCVLCGKNLTAECAEGSAKIAENNNPEMCRTPAKFSFERIRRYD